MHLVEQRLNSFTYRFRRLTWREEASLVVPPGADARDVILARALHDVSDFPVGSPEDAAAIIRRIPATIRFRLFIVYRGNLPEDRYYTSGGLYQAPGHSALGERVRREDEAEPTEAADAELVRRYGAEEAREARQMEQTLAQQAIKARRA